MSKSGNNIDGLTRLSRWCLANQYVWEGKTKTPSYKITWRVRRGYTVGLRIKTMKKVYSGFDVLRTHKTDIHIAIDLAINEAMKLVANKRMKQSNDQ